MRSSSLCFVVRYITPHRSVNFNRYQLQESATLQLNTQDRYHTSSNTVDFYHEWDRKGEKPPTGD